jgi:hypothetical protein
MDDKDKRIKELEEVAMELYNLVHESDLIENKIKANDLYYIIKPEESKINYCYRFTYKDEKGIMGNDIITISEKDCELAIAKFEKKHPNLVWCEFTNI